MSDTQEIFEYLARWETKRFRPNEITFAEAARSLSTTEPLVVAKPGSSLSKWILMNTNTDKVAILVFVGIWRWGSDLETGNFVPKGKHAPDGLPSERMQDTPSFKCELTYTFDTSVDDSIWSHLRAFENHVTSLGEFNRGLRPRRKWQDRKRPEDREKYQITAKLFSRRTPFNSKANGTTSIPYNIHPWISNAVKDSKTMIANPEKPQYYDFSDGVLRRLTEIDEPCFNRNDIVLVSCKVGFVITGDSWFTEITPLELIRVDKLPEATNDSLDVSLYPSPNEDFTTLELGEPLELFEGPATTTMKRKRGDSEVPDPTPDKRRTLESSPDPESELTSEPGLEHASEQAQGSEPVAKSETIHDSLTEAEPRLKPTQEPKAEPPNTDSPELSVRQNLRSKSSRANRR